MMGDREPVGVVRRFRVAGRGRPATCGRRSLQKWMLDLRLRLSLALGGMQRVTSRRRQAAG